MSYKHLYILFFLFAACGVMSCKKKHNDNPFGSSKIATITTTHQGEVRHYRMVYDNYNNVDSIIITADYTSSVYYKYFRYFGSSYSVTDESNNTFTVEATTAGQILRILTLDTLSMLYNGSQLAELDEKIPLITYPYYSISQTSFMWQNGDITKYSVSGTPYTVDYDNSKSGQPGDAWRIDEFMAYGRSYTKTTHLPVDKMSGNTWAEKYFYTTDGGGRVNQFIKVINSNGNGSDDTMIYAYTYY